MGLVLCCVIFCSVGHALTSPGVVNWAAAVAHVFLFLRLVQREGGAKWREGHEEMAQLAALEYSECVHLLGLLHVCQGGH